MIYKDSESCFDTDIQPAIRLERCSNCGKLRSYHFGWRCPTSNFSQIKFTELPSDSRFITPSMMASLKPTNNPSIPYSPPPPPTSPIAPTPSVSSASVNVSDWRKWRDIGKKEDECACGIHRSDCTFHRVTSSDQVGWLESD